MRDQPKIPLKAEGAHAALDAAFAKQQKKQIEAIAAKEKKTRSAAGGSTPKHHGNGAAAEEPPPIWESDEYGLGLGYGGGPKARGATREFKPVRFKDVKFVPTTQDLIKGLFPKDGLIVVWGPPKCGKSFWVYDAGIHVARGEFYRGRRVIQGLVVYIACEGERGLKARTEAYRQTLPAGDDPAFYLLTTQLDLVVDVDNLIRDIRSAVGEDTPALIVVDTLNRSLAGSENNPEDMTDYIQASDTIRREFNGSSIVLIHHCGIDGTRPRGFTGLSAAADAQIKTVRDAAENIVATVEFMKDGDAGDRIVSKLRVIEIAQDEYGDAITSCVVEPADPTEIPPETKRLSAAQQSALNLLDQAIAKAGVIPPACDHIPTNTPCVTEALWRKYCYDGQISESDEPDAKRMAFKRSAKALHEKGQVGKWADFVWIVR